MSIRNRNTSTESGVLPMNLDGLERELYSVESIFEETIQKNKRVRERLEQLRREKNEEVKRQYKLVVPPPPKATPPDGDGGSGPASILSV